MSEVLPVRYRSPDEDSARWVGFPFRDGDIVISTRSKTGTTWIQMICALLVFQTAELPAPLGQLSPWLDWLVTPRDDVYAALAAQNHRRFIKTHTPLDGIPLDRHAIYIVAARHPLDMAVSLYHQGDNLDRERIRRLTGQPEPAGPAPVRPPLREWLLAWIDWDGRPQDQLDSLPGVLWHLSDAWARRGESNIALVHYDDLSNDLGGEMRRVAALLGISVADTTGPSWSMPPGSSRCEPTPNSSPLMRPVFSKTAPGSFAGDPRAPAVNFSPAPSTRAIAPARSSWDRRIC